jgi:hypothetical protein
MEALMMRLVGWVVTVAILSAPLVARADGSTTIVKNNQSKSIVCKTGDAIEVAGNKNSVALSGECKSVVVSGNENTVTIEAAGSIDTPGNKNKVSWRRGLEGKDATLSNLGNGNTVTHVK